MISFAAFRVRAWHRCRPAGLVLAAVIALSACIFEPPGRTVAAVEPAQAEVAALLAAQSDAWNAGDIEGFMAGYWRSPDLRFASGGEVTRGFDETLARYRARYPDRAAMGRLDFSDQEIIVLAGDAAIAHGRWRLERASGAVSGLYTLVLRRIDGSWRIVSDTTTLAAQ